MSTAGTGALRAEGFHTCVFYADACDYTARLTEDEARAITEIIEARRLIARTIARFSGNLVDQSGDSVLAWFARPAAAVECAMAVQSSLAQRPGGGTTRGPPKFRIGIAAGDISKRGGSIYGQVVAQAARLQSLAGPGRIVISPEVRVLCAGLAAVRSADPVRALLKPDEPIHYGYEISVAEGPQLGQDGKRRLGHAPLIVVAPLVTPPGDMAAAINARIFLEMLLECIYREQAEATVVESYAQAIRTSGAESGGPVYLVTGGARTASARGVLSISVLYGEAHRLVSADRHVVEEGAEAFSILQSLAESTFRAIIRSELESSLLLKTVPKGVFQLYSRARNAMGALSETGVQKAIGSLEDCLRLDPEFARGWAMLGKAYSLAWRFSWATNARDALTESIALTERAIEFAPNDPVIVAQSGFTQMWAREIVRAQHDCDSALALGLSDPDEIANLAMILHSQARSDEAISLLQQSIRTSPQDGDIRFWALADILFSGRRYGDANNALRRMKNSGQASRLAAACAARLGLNPDRYVHEVLAQQRDFSVRNWISIQPPATSDELEDFASALLKAGLPW